MSNPTIGDVAKRAGYSKATVSAVLNDSEKVKDSTRQKTLAAMDELNYGSRASARNGFRPCAARSLGLIIKEVDNPYYAKIVAGAITRHVKSRNKPAPERINMDAELVVRASTRSLGPTESR